MDDREVLKTLKAARQVAILHYPHYSPILTRVQLRIAEGLMGLACVDLSGRIYFNRSKTEELLRESTPEHRLKCLAFVILHECMHLLRDHHDRSSFAPYPEWATEEELRHHAWNLACDLEINANLGNWISLLPPTWRPITHMNVDIWGESLAEGYLSKLSESSLEHIPFADEGSGVFASCGLIRGWEIHSDSEQETFSGWSQLDRTIIKHEVAEAILKSQDRSRSEIIWASSIARTKRDWREILRSRIKRVHSQHHESNRTRIDFRRPSRIQNVSRPLLIPNRRSEECFLITIVVDTSGSMDVSLLQIAMGEIDRIAKTSERFHVEIIQCDDEVTSHSEYRSNDHYEFHGRGGTDMVHGVEVALRLRESTAVKDSKANKLHPGIVIVMTDGWTPFPDRKYDTEVLWCIIENPSQTLPMPWTEQDVVHVGSTDKQGENQ